MTRKHQKSPKAQLAEVEANKEDFRAALIGLLATPVPNRDPEGTIDTAIEYALKIPAVFEQRRAAIEEEEAKAADAEAALSESENYDSDDDALSSLTVAELRELPEWQDVPNKSELTHKADIIDAIARVRKQ